VASALKVNLMYRSTWYELICPQCNLRNFVNDGDTQDMTLPDIDACKCWNCSHCFDFEGNPVDEDGDVNCEDGGESFQKT
jgi:hypothetical protein